MILKFTYILSIVFATILSPDFVYGQSTHDLLRLYFNEVRSGKYPAIPKQLSLAENSNTTLTAMPVYLSDTLAAVRGKAYAITQLAALNTRVLSLRVTGVSYLVNACRDKDSGNAGLALNYLTAFRKEDFSIEAKDSIRNFVRRKTSHFDQLLKLAGFLDLKDLQNDIRPYTQPGSPQQVRWAAILSLARLGDAAASENMMTRVRKVGVNDDVVYEVFPDLVYSRQREAIDYLITVLKSDEKNCMTADAERETPIACGYRVMEQLAAAIENYPLQLDESGDIKTKDYATALNIVRDWFGKNQNYNINRDTF